MIHHPGLVASAEDIKALAAALKNEKVIAFDTEFIRETTFYPIVEIIQIATREKSWLVDAQAFKHGHPHGFKPKNGKAPFDPAIQPLLDIFADRGILKILHAAQGDQECLYTSFGVIASPSLDTAVAASLCGYGDGIGLGKLLAAVCGVKLEKGHARSNWSVRPLPEQLTHYAHADVDHLVELGEILLGKLDEIGRRKWAMELSAKWEDKSLYDPDPEDLAVKLARGGRVDRRGFAALRELIRWREDRVKQLNLPRRWVADDAVILDLARVRPKDLSHLSTFRGLNKGEVKNSGEAILAALKRASEDKESSLPAMPKADIPSVDEMQVLDLLKCYIGILADEHRIAVRHLLTVGQLLPLLKRKCQTREELIEGGMSPDAAALLGDELLAFIKGERALSVDGKRVKIVSVSEKSG